MGNPVMHWQILTKNPKKLEEFYAALFGWKISGDNPMGYRQVDTMSAKGIGGGLWPISEKEGHSMVQLFIHVEDVKAHAKKAEGLGAHIVIPPQTLPGGDEMAVAVDPDGIPFAMFRRAGNSPQ
ncbi:MAG TPA: VOC family protein [Terriglobales bacterium]|nr:VOC family protein [Terriglobales bacterium]